MSRENPIEEQDLHAFIWSSKAEKGRKEAGKRFKYR